MVWRLICVMLGYDNLRDIFLLLVNNILKRIIQNDFDNPMSICAIESIYSISTLFQSFQQFLNKYVGFQIILLFVYRTQF